MRTLSQGGSRANRYFFCLLALGANPKDAMAVMKWLETILLYDFILQVLYLFVVKLNQRAAIGADQMIVMTVLIIVFVKRSAIVKLELSRESALFQQFQRAIDRRESNRGVLCLHKRVQVFTRNMPLSVQKHVENQIALRRTLQTLASQMFVE